MYTQTVLILGHASETTRQWADAFQQRGMRVNLTASPSDVQRVWREASPMLTVLDASIPFVEAVRLCRELRALSPAPILMLLASNKANELTEAYRAGATECLVQPAGPAVILLKAMAWSMRHESTLTSFTNEWASKGPYIQNIASGAF
jgi:DNA-binding response OmpR family regulator